MLSIKTVFEEPKRESITQVRAGEAFISPITKGLYLVTNSVDDDGELDGDLYVTDLYTLKTLLFMSKDAILNHLNKLSLIPIDIECTYKEVRYREAK